MHRRVQDGGRDSRERDTVKSMKTINVVAAIIVKDGEIFATQRGYGDYKDWWEFPGGKIEPGETPEEALVREIREELHAEIEVGRLVDTVEYDYPKFHMVMRCYLCRLISEEIELVEHEAARWLGDRESVWRTVLRGMTDYKLMNSQLMSLSDGVGWDITILSNAAALLWDSLKDINWAGFYLIRGGRLELGPFQGKPACTVIEIGKGVCGTAVAQDRTQLVKNVHEFPGHIACDSASNSEIVVPMHAGGNICGVLDIDSPILARFDEEDKAGLEAFVRILESILEK